MTVSLWKGELVRGDGHIEDTGRIRSASQDTLRLPRAGTGTGAECPSQPSEERTRMTP